MSGRLPRDPDSGWDEEKERREEMTASVDVSKIKVGDTVSAVVAQVDKDGVYLAPTGRWLPTPCIVSHTPAPKPPLKVGDRVLRPDGDEFEIVGPPRSSRANDGRPEVAIWCAVMGYFFYPAAEVETWERLS